MSTLLTDRRSRTLRGLDDDAELHSDPEKKSYAAKSIDTCAKSEHTVSDAALAMSEGGDGQEAGSRVSLPNSVQVMIVAPTLGAPNLSAVAATDGGVAGGSARRPSRSRLRGPTVCVGAPRREPLAGNPAT